MKLCWNITSFAVFISWGKVESKDMNVCYTLFCIIKCIIVAENQEMLFDKTFTARQCRSVFRHTKEKNPFHYIIMWDKSRRVYIKFCLLCVVLVIVSILVFRVASVERMQLHYFLNASQVTLANIVRVDLWQHTTTHNNAQIADIDVEGMTISTPSDFKAKYPVFKWRSNKTFTIKWNSGQTCCNYYSFAA